MMFYSRSSSCSSYCGGGSRSFESDTIFAIGGASEVLLGNSVADLLFVSSIFFFCWTILYTTWKSSLIDCTIWAVWKLCRYMITTQFTHAHTHAHACTHTHIAYNSFFCFVDEQFKSSLLACHNDTEHTFVLTVLGNVSQSRYWYIDWPYLCT